MSVDQTMKINFKKYDHRYDIKNMICADFSRRPELFIHIYLDTLYKLPYLVIKLHEILCNEISDSLTIGLLRSIKDVLLKSDGSN